MSNTSHIAPVEAEFKGAFSKSLSSKGAEDFAFLLAMLHQDVSNRLNLVSTEETPQDTREVELASIDFYPKTPLETEAKHWQQQQFVTSAIAQNDLASARLMNCMFPPPLSIKNDPQHIPDDVLANSDIFCQQRMQGEMVPDIPVNEAMLADIIPKATEALPDVQGMAY